MILPECGFHLITPVLDAPVVNSDTKKGFPHVLLMQHLRQTKKFYLHFQKHLFDILVVFLKVHCISSEMNSAIYIYISSKMCLLKYVSMLSM